MGVIIKLQVKISREVNGFYGCMPDNRTSSWYSRPGILKKSNDRQPSESREKKALKKKIHRALLEARNAQHNGDHEAAREIVRQMMAEAAPAAYRASLEGGFNWVVEALKPLDELMLPDDNNHDH